MSKNHLNYQDVVNLRFRKNKRYAGAEPNGDLNINRTQSKQWETFLLLNPNDLSSQDSIKYGDEVAILSYHNKFVVCENNNSVKANRHDIGSWEKWRFFDFFDHDKKGNIEIVGSGNYKNANVFIKSYKNTILLPGPAGEATASETQVDTSQYQENQNNVVIGLLEPWDFYYDRSIPYYDADGNNLCESRGRYDGANCFIGKPPKGSHFGGPFILNNQFYYSCSSPNAVVMGHWDGANAKVGNNSYEDSPFIFEGNYYLKPNAISDCTINDFYLTGKVKICPQPNALSIEIYPKIPTPVVSQDGFVLGSTDVPLSGIKYFQVCYKEMGTFGLICKNSVKFSDSHTKILDNLKANTLYMVKVSFKQKSGGNKITMGTTVMVTR